MMTKLYHQLGNKFFYFTHHNVLYVLNNSGSCYRSIFDLSEIEHNSKFILLNKMEKI